MAASLTRAQMRDAGYLANLIGTLRNQQTNELRQNEMTTQQNMRRLRQNNALNGINGGFEESNYARLLAGQNQAAANISNQYRPQLTEYQGYLDALNAARAAGGGGGGGTQRRYPRTDSSYSGDMNEVATSNLASSLMARALYNQGYGNDYINSTVGKRIKGATPLKTRMGY